MWKRRLRGIKGAEGTCWEQMAGRWARGRRSSRPGPAAALRGHSREPASPAAAQKASRQLRERVRAGKEGRRGRKGGPPRTTGRDRRRPKPGWEGSTGAAAVGMTLPLPAVPHPWPCGPGTSAPRRDRSVGSSPARRPGRRYTARAGPVSWRPRPRKRSRSRPPLRRRDPPLRFRRSKVPQHGPRVRTTSPPPLAKPRVGGPRAPGEGRMVGRAPGRD